MGALLCTEGRRTRPSGLLSSRRRISTRTSSNWTTQMRPRRRKTPPPKLGPRLWARRREKIFTLKSRRRAQTSKKRSLIVWRRIEEIGVEGLADDVDPDPDPDPDPDASATLTRHLKKGQPERSDRPSAKRRGARREKRSAGGVEKTVMATKQREDMLVKARQCRLLSTKREREREMRVKMWKHRIRKEKRKCESKKKLERK